MTPTMYISCTPVSGWLALCSVVRAYAGDTVGRGLLLVTWGDCARECGSGVLCCNVLLCVVLCCFVVVLWCVVVCCVVSVS